MSAENTIKKPDLSGVSEVVKEREKIVKGKSVVKK